MQKLIVFGTYHQVQGLENSPFTNVIDPDYRAILGRLMEVYHVNFIFEEASKYGPSVAFEMVPNDRYVDIDSETTDEALSQFQQPAETNFLPEIFPPEFLAKTKLQLTPTKVGLPAQNWREECWVKKIKAEQFEKGLVICGAAHSLSIAFRLKAEGFDVEAFTYEPTERLCNTYVRRKEM